MDGGVSNSAASIGGKLLDSLANGLRGVATFPEAGKPAQPKYEVVGHYSNLGGSLIVSSPNSSAIASIRESDGVGEATQITASRFPEFLQDLEKILKQMGRSGHTLPGEFFDGWERSLDEGETSYEAIVGIPLGMGGSQYRS